MKFAQPIWLFVGLIACAALLWRYRRFDARQRTELKKFASESLIGQLTASVSAPRRQLKRALVVAGIAFVGIALARPLAGFRWEETKRKGLDLLLAVDTSKSMLAQDVKPDRLTRAKMAVEDLLGHLDGDRVGLLAFAGNAFLQCPLTLDYDAFRQSLDAVDTRIIPRGGTDIASAIHEAEAALEGQGHNERILVLITDGEDLEGSALEAARAAAKHGLKIFTVGVGNANGELIPVVDDKGETQFVKDSSGQFVKSRLDESMLKQIAEATGGMYVPLGQQGQGLETIYQKGLAPFTRHELASRMHKVYLERYQWPLALGLLCLVLEPLIGIRRRKRIQHSPKSTRPALVPSWNKMARSSGAVATVTIALAVLGSARPAEASVSKGEKAFQKGDFAKAEQEYAQAAAKSPNKPVLQFNTGAAAYKAGNFDAAAQSFTRAMKTDDLKLQQDDYYNLGNAQYRIGQKTEKANTQETIKTWEQAVQSYEAALQLKADDVDAKYNRDLVKRKLEELKKQQQQQQQQNQQNQQNQNQDNKDNQKNQNKQDQNKQDQNQNKQDQQNQKNGGPGQQNQPDKQNSQSQSKQDNQQNKDQNKQRDHQNQQAKQNQQEPSKSSTGKDQQQSKSSGQSGKQDQATQNPQQQQPQEQQNQPSRQTEQAKNDPDASGQARNPHPNQAGQEQIDARPEPGKMSREEAKELLDSLKADDRKMPLEPYARGNESARSDETLKDW
jgi:Ca-activated chloride channel family protein